MGKTSRGDCKCKYLTSDMYLLIVTRDSNSHNDMSCIVGAHYVYVTVLLKPFCEMPEHFKHFMK